MTDLAEWYTRAYANGGLRRLAIIRGECGVCETVVFAVGGGDEDA